MALTESGFSMERLYFDDQTGQVIGERGTRKDSAGDLFAQIQYPLHSGRIAGFAGRSAHRDHRHSRRRCCR